MRYNINEVTAYNKRGIVYAANAMGATVFDVTGGQFHGNWASASNGANNVKRHATN